METTKNNKPVYMRPNIEVIHLETMESIMNASDPAGRMGDVEVSDNNSLWEGIKWD